MQPANLLENLKLFDLALVLVLVHRRPGKYLAGAIQRMMPKR